MFACPILFRTMLENNQNKLKLLRSDALYIVKKTIESVLPDKAVEVALREFPRDKKVIFIAIGKAAWRMAFTAKKVLGNTIEDGIVITKYNHSHGDIQGLEIWEAGHPIPDENSINATNRALEKVKNLTEREIVLFLVSGGGSALFEKPLPGISLTDLTSIYEQLLKSGANILEINTIRKHMSSVKVGVLHSSLIQLMSILWFYRMF